MNKSKTLSVHASGPDHLFETLSREQLEACFDQAAAELRWVKAQENLAIGLDSVDIDDSGGGSSSGAKSLFGSEQWLRVFVVTRLCCLKIGFDQIDEEHSTASGQSHGLDYDKYVHLNI